VLVVLPSASAATDCNAIQKTAEAATAAKCTTTRLAAEQLTGWQIVLASALLLQLASALLLQLASALLLQLATASFS
jgi:hypothetical protein